MDMEQFQRRMKQTQRATVARSALDIIAMIFIGCAFAFWFAAFWQMIAPPSILSLGTVSVLVLTLVYSLAAPLLLSMLVPTTPAGQLLQKTQWRTIGFPVIVMAALFLCWQGFTLIGAWLAAQGGIDPTTGKPALQTTGQVLPMAISLAIAFILIPALAWIQVSPEMWMQQIQQAHMVKKLELQQRGELAIIKASMVRATSLAEIGWANLLPLEQEEAIGTMRGLLMASSDTMRSIVKTLGLSSDLERSIMRDDEIADHLDYVKRSIDIVPDLLPAAAHVDSRSQSSESRATPREVAPQTTAAHVDSRLQSLIPRGTSSDQVAPSRTQSDQVYDAIARDLPTVFTAADVSERMRWTDKREGQRVIRAWLDEGVAKEVRLGRYSLT